MTSLKGVGVSGIEQPKNEQLPERDCSLCGITKTLRFHMHPHTFATTMTLANNVPIETVSKMRGHTDIETAQLLDPQVGSDMKNSQEKLELNKGHYPINLEGRSKKRESF